MHNFTEKPDFTENRPAPLAVLFDLDGVLIDTEPQYDVFWQQIGERYRPDIPSFGQRIKGTTLPNILADYFSHLPEAVRQKIAAANHAFDLQLEMIPIPGAMAFLYALKQTGVKMGLVTSSDDDKLAIVFRTLPIRGLFDTIVSADRITQGKPHPMCYLLAADDLDVTPAQCVVFEDSTAGLTAAKNADMRVIGLATTLPEETIRTYTSEVIADFSDVEAVMKLIFSLKRKAFCRDKNNEQ
ncbi:MAG: HAD family phosphatase [Prevotellaceae bacterium]|jgi:HAD superfamily hydrolase (TIGR01509 family)|nr:HAD family phosphatase [Prevotellaceae bacterium]